MGSQQKKKKRTQDSRSLTGEIKRTQDLDINNLALQPTFELGYTPLGVGTVSFVNVSTSLGPSQGGSGFPAQVTGLTVTPHAGSDTQLDLAWTAITAPDFNYYNVYRGITSGFVVDSSSEIAQPVTNSYNNTGLSPGTTYYYRVSVTNDAELEGTPSSQVSGTTTGTASLPTSLWLGFDNNYNDSSGNNATIIPTMSNTGFGTPGKFGTHYGILNWPSVPNTSNPDRLIVTNTTNVMPDFTNKFSISLWIQPKDVSDIAGSNGRWILGIQNPSTTYRLSLLIKSSELVLYCTSDSNAPTRRRVGALVNGTWYHVVITANFSTDTINLYTDKVATATTTGGPAVAEGSANLNIGALSSSLATSYYEGYIDELKLWNGQEFNQTQVNNLFATNAP